MTPIIPPQPVEYTGSTLPFTSNNLNPPPEGPRCVPIAITWATDGGPFASVHVKVSGGYQPSILALSQISTLFVDNLKNEQPALFYFTDTQFFLEVPPLSFGYYPVITNQLEFVIWSPNASTNDQTRIQVLNYALPPSVVSEFAFADVASGTLGSGSQPLNISAGTNGSVDLSPTVSEGILQSINVIGSGLQKLQESAVATLMLSNQAQSVIYWSCVLSSNNFPWWKDIIVLADQTPMNIDFIGPVWLSVVQAATCTLSGLVSASITWRIP